MKTAAFLRRVLGDSGHYCVLAIEKGTGRKLQKFYNTIDEVYAAAVRLDQSEYNVFFALATFETTENRKAVNVSQMRSLFLDLDCGEEKGFADQTEALEQLQNFCRRLALPKPLIVNSGRGLHVYWPLDRPVSRDEWQPVADRFKALCKQHNFRVDTSVAADAARVLRVPGTHNHKGEPPLPVAVLAEAANNTMTLAQMSDLLGVAKHAVAPRAYMPMQRNATQDLLMANRTSRFRTILRRADGCAQLQYAATEQDKVDEPLWRATLSIAVHCEDADVAVHAVSKNHPEYSFDDTEAKARRIKGPYLCATFDDYNPGLCAQCPHWQKIKSPIVLGRELKTADTEEERTVTVESPEPKKPATTVTVPKYPSPYVRGAAGGVYRRGTDEEGNPEDTLIYHHDIYLTRRLWDVEIGYMVMVSLHLPRDGIREFVIPQQTVSSSDELRRVLASQGVTCKTKKQWDAMSAYITDYIEELQMREVAAHAHRQFGWTKDLKSFVLGNREYFPTHVGYTPDTPPTARLMEAFEPKGTLEQWKELMEFYNKPGLEMHQWVICAGFGSPLMEFSGVSALMTHFDGPSGFGKTTTQFAMLGIYGKPELLSNRKSDTVNSKMLRLEVMKNLPVVFDELTNMDERVTSDFIYDVADGRQKNRMAGGANLERYRGMPWGLRVMSSGNRSLLDLLYVAKADPDAERERVFEVNLKDHEYARPKDAGDEFQKAVKSEVYGVAADPYIKWLVANVEKAQEIFLGTQKRLDARVGFTSKNRYISAGLAADMAGGLIASKLGLIPFDMKNLFEFIVELAVARQRRVAASKRDGMDYLNEYISHHYNDILRIKSTQDMRKVKDQVAEEFVVPDASPRGQYVARYETDLKRLYLLPKPFREWCVKRQLNPTSVLEDIQKKYTVNRVRIRLGKGTKLALPPAETYAIDFILDEDPAGDGADT